MEGILVIISFVFLCTVNVLMWTRNPNSNFLDWYTGKGLRFEKSRLSAYVRVVSIVGLISAVCGFLLSQSYQSALGFAAINMAIMAASGVNLILYKDAKQMKPENNIPIKLWADATVLSIFVVLFVIEVLLAATPHLGPTVRVSTKQNALLL